MLSDESSSDSETGRFKCKSTNQEQKKSSNQREDNTRFSGRNRPSDESRSRRDLDRQRDERERFGRHNRDRHRHSRYSPVSRRRNSRDRSDRRSHDRIRHRGDSTGRSKPADYRSSSRDRHKRSGSHSQKPPEHSRDLKAEIRRNLCPKDEKKERSLEKSERKSLEKILSSPEPRAKKSEIHRPSPIQSRKRKSESPILVEHSDESEEVKPGSYYSMIPAIIKEKSDESSEIDSSDDEKLRAKLLNLEKELHKTRKKKHKKRHKRKSSKSSKDREHDPVTLVEVSSTTDIQENTEIDKQKPTSEPIEVSSTQKSILKESESESGEISSDENSENDFEIDATDLRHKLKRSGLKQQKYAKDVCGPALPPHLQNRYAGSSSDIEGPALPPHLKSRSKNIGPVIPDDMRKVLAETDHGITKQESSDEDVGIGPLPTGAEGKWSEAHKRLEERALNMKLKQLEGQSFHSEKIKSREQWMLELPESKAKIIGLEARSFRAKEGPDMSDRSSWTDTPEEKARKAAGFVKEEDADVALQREAKARQMSIRDEEQEAAIKKHKKKHKREESLLEMHQKKLKKKKKKEEKDDDKKERRPFSRDVDLQVNRFDEAQKKSIIKKAQDLNTRFSRGDAKFL